MFQYIDALSVIVFLCLNQTNPSVTHVFHIFYLSISPSLSVFDPLENSFFSILIVHSSLQKPRFCLEVSLPENVLFLPLGFVFLLFLLWVHFYTFLLLHLGANTVVYSTSIKCSFIFLLFTNYFFSFIFVYGRGIHSNNIKINFIFPKTVFSGVTNYK